MLRLAPYVIVATCLFVLTASFQNCSGIKFSQSADTNSSKDGGGIIGNGGYDGKTYVLVDESQLVCGDKVVGRIFQPRDKTQYLLTRSNCIDIPSSSWLDVTAKSVPPDVVTMGSEFVIYQDRTYLREFTMNPLTYDHLLFKAAITSGNNSVTQSSISGKLSFAIFETNGVTSLKIGMRYNRFNFYPMDPPPQNDPSYQDYLNSLVFPNLVRTKFGSEIPADVPQVVFDNSCAEPDSISLVQTGPNSWDYSDTVIVQNPGGPVPPQIIQSLIHLSYDPATRQKAVQSDSFTLCNKSTVAEQQSLIAAIYDAAGRSQEMKDFAVSFVPYSMNVFFPGKNSIPRYIHNYDYKPASIDQSDFASKSSLLIP